MPLEQEEQEHLYRNGNTSPRESKAFRIAGRLLGDTGGGLPSHRSRARRPRDAAVSPWTASPSKTCRAATPARSTASLTQAWGCSSDSITGGRDNGDAVCVGDRGGG